MHRNRRPGGFELSRERNYATKTEPAGYSKYPKEIKFHQFLLLEYGNSDFAIDIADSILSFAQKFFRGKKKYQTTVTLLKYGIPAAILTSQIVEKFKKYRKIKSGDNGIYDQKQRELIELMGIDNKRLCEVRSLDFPLGREVFNWIFQKSKTTKFKVLGFYNYDGLKPIADVFAVDSGVIFILIEFEGEKIVIEANILFSMQDECMVRSPILHHTGDPEKPPRLKATIFKEFIDHYDTTNNVIYLHSNEMRTFPRQHIKEETLQFNMDRFADEIRKVLKRGKKRGFAFVGVPGTGKSTIIRKLESVITEYPIVYATQSNFLSEYDIAETFMTMSYLQPCIVILEDLDSYDLKDKKRNLGVFLDCIDDVNNRLNVVFLATINDTSLVHYSLINRPGRLDQVIMVKAPQNREGVHKVMQTRYLKNLGEDTGRKEFMPIEDVDESLMAQILSKEYTQADICEIIEKALLLSDDITNETLLKSLKELEESKRAIERCNFRGQDPTLAMSDDGPSDGKSVGKINRPLIR